jgi:acetyltransferase-like isoleucine patch superfamily enzyme
LAERLDDPAVDRAVTVRDLLAELVYGRSYAELADGAPWAALALDPRNVVFEAEQYVATDPARFAAVKPLLWAWNQVDRTPFGRSLASGVPFRRILAERVFARVGTGLILFPDVEVSVGYNLEVGNDVVLHRHVFLDDIGGIEIHDGASLSDHAHVYSHTHDLLESEDVKLKRTVIGRGVRVAYHATVLAGTVLSDDAMLGALAVATRDVAPHTVALGVPARPRRTKARAGDPRFASLEVDARTRPASPAVRANPDYAALEAPTGGDDADGG